MESYIVRVYRRNQSDLNGISGLVETVGTDERKEFQSFSSLVTAIRQALGEDDQGTRPGQHRLCATRLTCTANISEK
jgi:hypothetical protein